MSDAQVSRAPSAGMKKRLPVPMQLLDQDVPADVRGWFQSQLEKIANLYDEYEQGVDFSTEGTKGDYIPAKLLYRKCRKLIDDEARFMFANAPDVRITGTGDPTQTMEAAFSSLTDFVKKVLKKNRFATKLIQAAKDCFIAGRVCLLVNFNDAGIQVDFVNALEFYYEFRDGRLDKLVIFYHTNNAVSSVSQRIQKKSYKMTESGFCVVTDSVYDGSGKLLEGGEELQTDFNYIPACIILNDGLTGDLEGESEIGTISDFESYYSKLANAGKDALRKGMNGIKYIIDGSRDSTKDLGTGPGAVWDISSDIELHENGKASVGQLSPDMGFSTPLKEELMQIENAMFGMLSMPNVTSEQLQGVITSGKTLRALYWPMVVRCSEKENVWVDAIEFLVQTIVEGSRLVPQVVDFYTDENLPDVEFMPLVETNYALPDDEDEEKIMDLQQVNAMTMSRKSYMMKWSGMTEKEADAELQQILFEKQLLEDSSFDSAAFGSAAPQTGEADPEAEEEMDDNSDAGVQESGEENFEKGIDSEQES